MALPVPKHMMAFDEFGEYTPNSMRVGLCVWDKTRSSADADNRLDAFSGQSRSTNMDETFHMLHIG